MYLSIHSVLSIYGIFTYMSTIYIGTEVYMGEAGQDMYIDTIGMCVWCPCNDVYGMFLFQMTHMLLLMSSP